MNLHAVIPLSNGSIAVRDTSCICHQCYNDGTYFASCAGWVKHTLTRAALDRPNEPESSRMVEMPTATISTTELSVSNNEGKQTKPRKRPRKTKSSKSKSVQSSSWYCFLCSESTPEDMIKCQVCYQWSHIACSGVDLSSNSYVCELCV